MNHQKGCNSAVILAAGKSSRFYGEPTLTRHKSTEAIIKTQIDKLNIKNEKFNNTILGNLINILLISGVNRIIIVVNDILNFDFVKEPRIELISNPEFSAKSSSGSVALGLRKLSKSDCTLVIDGDLYFSNTSFENVYAYLNGNNFLVTPHTSSGDECVATFKNGEFFEFTKNIKEVEKTGHPEFLGISHLSPNFITKFLTVAEETSFTEPYEKIFPIIAKMGEPVGFLYSSTFKWKDLDNIEDIKIIRKLQQSENV